MNATPIQNLPKENLPKEKVQPVESGRKTLLLVDDDPAIRQILLRLLADENYRVLTAANGAEAVEVAEANRIDLVLLDLNMPVQDGWQAFEQLTAGNPALPIIVITARPNQIFPALASGAGALLEKPLDFAKLFQAIRELLAEPAEERIARMAGRAGVFRYAASVPGEKN
jgi:CheY-like chemotaxis protein